MVYLLLSAVDYRLETWSDQTKDYKICIFCFSAKHAALRNKSKDWLTRYQEIFLSETTCYSIELIDKAIK